MDNKTDIKINELNSLDNLSKVDELLDKAANSIDNGKYEDAIEEFGQVVEITQSIFGNNVELAEVKQKIKDIQDVLKQIK